MPTSILGQALRLTWVIYGDAFTAAEAHAAVAREGVAVDIGEFETMLHHLAEDTDAVSRQGEGEKKFYEFPRRPRRSRARNSMPTNNVALSAVPASGMGVQRRIGDGTRAPVLARGLSLADDVLAPPAAPKAQRARRRASAPTPSSDDTPTGMSATVRCIAPPHLDGGTSFRIDASPAKWSTRLRALVSAWTNGHRLPPTVDLVDGDGVVLTARVKRGGAGTAINLVFDNEAQLALFPRIGAAFLEAKARALWVHGAETWMAKWFAWGTYLLTGNRCAAPSTAHALGWTTSRLELAADFAGLVFCKDDTERFVNARGGAELVSSKGSKRRGLAETINIGRRGKHCLALSTHDKTQAIRSKKGTPTDSVYAATWRANGWDGTENVRRVEARAHGRALRLAARDGTLSVLDLHDPASLLDSMVLGNFWVHATTTRTRLVTEKPNVGRARSLPTDPRWVEVQAAGGAASTVRYVQVPRETRLRANHAELVRRAKGEVARALGRLVSLQSVQARDLDVETLITAILRDRAFAEERAVAESSLDGWPLPPLDVAPRTPSSGHT